MHRRHAPPPSRTRRGLLLAAGIGAASVALGRRTLSDPSRWLPDQAAGPDQLSLAAEHSRRDLVEAQPIDVLPEAIAPTKAPVLDPTVAQLDNDHLFDLVITGGRVIDPATGFDGLANVGIDGDLITSITADPIRGATEIDAKASVVAPGFIDLLSYEPNLFGAWLKISDGVTTNLAMHGVSNYADNFFATYEGRTPVHFGGALNHHYVRANDAGLSIGTAASNAAIGRLVDLARTNLDHGFAGISFSPEYSPGTTTAEMQALAEVAAEIGHVCFYHLRHSDPDPPGTSLEALEEVLQIARETGVSTHIEHLTSTGGTFVMDEAVAMISEARSEGLDITACVYPYPYWGTYLASARFSHGWQDRYRIDLSDLQVAGTPDRMTEEAWSEAVDRNLLVVAHGSIPEAEVAQALQQPWVVVASDAILTEGANNHPRGAGTFSRTIGHYVRGTGLLDLRTGLAKITILPALRVQQMLPAMARKGRLQIGADADITIFNPVTIADQATVAEPASPSVGIEWVIVEGQIALRDGAPDHGVLAGRALYSLPLT